MEKDVKSSSFPANPRRQDKHSGFHIKFQLNGFKDTLIKHSNTFAYGSPVIIICKYLFVCSRNYEKFRFSLSLFNSRVRLIVYTFFLYYSTFGLFVDSFGRVAICVNQDSQYLIEEKIKWIHRRQILYVLQIPMQWLHSTLLFNRHITCWVVILWSIGSLIDTTWMSLLEFLSRPVEFGDPRHEQCLLRSIPKGNYVSLFLMEENI